MQILCACNDKRVNLNPCYYNLKTIWGCPIPNWKFSVWQLTKSPMIDTTAPSKLNEP